MGILLGYQLETVDAISFPVQLHQLYLYSYYSLREARGAIPHSK
jgi:hypothetical protein